MKQKQKNRKKEIKEKKEINNRLNKDKIIRDIKTVFKQEEDYYKPNRVSNFWRNNYIEYESNIDINRNFSQGKYVNKIKSYLRNRINDLGNSDTWKFN